MFLNTLDEKAWQDFLSEFNQIVGSETKLDDFKEEFWNTVVKFGEPVLMGTGLGEKERGAAREDNQPKGIETEDQS